MKACSKKFGVGVNWNTHKKFTYCQRKKIWVDGCEDYIRVGGNEGDYSYRRLDKIEKINHPAAEPQGIRPPVTKAYIKRTCPR